MLFRTYLIPFGVCCLQYDGIVVTFLFDAKVIRYNSTGEFRQTYGNIAFRHPYGVAGSKVNKDIYVVDHETDECHGGKLIAIDRYGRNAI